MALREGSRFASDQSLLIFMLDMAERHRERERDNSLIRANTPDNFVADLIKRGYLTEVG